MNFVLDASVALSWCFADEGGAGALRVLDRLRSGEAVVPSLWPLEVTNGLLTAERRGRLEPSDAARALAMLASLPIAVEPLERRRAFESIHRLARTRGLSTYDATYVDLAARLGLPLATLDGPLAEASEAEGVPVLPD